MAGPNKSSLEYWCARAWLPIGVTKKELTQSDKACKARCCIEEIKREAQAGISAVDPRSGARWGNPAGLLKFDHTERQIEELANKQAEMATKLS